ncbi:MAG: hypothetical protein LBU34_14835, partial [Planctomycetaceae bacterium]|nr:hypothetical protein [Planctomycetaceae bacterium]
TAENTGITEETKKIKLFLYLFSQLLSNDAGQTSFFLLNNLSSLKFPTKPTSIPYSLFFNKGNKVVMLWEMLLLRLFCSEKSG